VIVGVDGIEPPAAGERRVITSADARTGGAARQASAGQASARPGLGGIEAANLDELAVDRAIGRVTAVFLRTGAKYAPLSQLDEYHDPAEKEPSNRCVPTFSGRSS
jgi:hypothetical protein